MENMVKSVKIGLLLLSFLTLGIATAVQADEAPAKQAAPANKVSYDKASDRLSVSVEAVPLKRVLGRIAQQSGIEVMFDDMADETVSFDIQANSLEDGLKRILKGRNHMLRYDRDEQKNLLLIGVMVLPVGEQDTGRAKRLVSMENEAFYRARSQMSIKQAQQMDLANERWQVRMSEMPSSVRERLEKKTASQLQRHMHNDKLRAAHNKKFQKRMAKHKEERNKRRELGLKELDPEQRAAFERDATAAREEMKLLLQKQPK